MDQKTFHFQGEFWLFSSIQRCKMVPVPSSACMASDPSSHCQYCTVHPSLLIECVLSLARSLFLSSPSLSLSLSSPPTLTPLHAEEYCCCVWRHIRAGTREAAHAQPHTLSPTHAPTHTRTVSMWAWSSSELILASPSPASPSVYGNFSGMR